MHRRAVPHAQANWIPWVFLIVMAVFILQEHRTHSRVEALTERVCHAQRTARAESNAGAEVLRSFIQSAATARARSARFETGKQRQIDLTAAAEFRSLLAREIHILPPIEC